VLLRPEFLLGSDAVGHVGQPDDQPPLVGDRRRVEGKREPAPLPLPTGLPLELGNSLSVDRLVNCRGYRLAVDRLVGLAEVGESHQGQRPAVLPEQRGRRGVRRPDRVRLGIAGYRRRRNRLDERLHHAGCRLAVTIHSYPARWAQGL